MMYDFCCTKCNTTQCLSMTYKQRKDEEELASIGMHSIKCKCGSPCEYNFVPTDASVSLKGVGWVSRDTVESKNRAARVAAVGKKQRDHVKPLELVPNYKGDEAHTWRDVQDHVRSTKGDLAASTYQPMVSKETSR